MNEKIYYKLKRKILFLELLPGESIDEKKIAAEFKVSRTPIREVLQKLEWEGLVSIIPRGIISVTPLEYNIIQNTYFLRINVEGLAGKLAAKYGQPKHIIKLEALLERMKGLKKNLDIQQFFDNDSDFREIVYDATNNPVLKQVSDTLYDKTLRIWSSNIRNDQSNAVLKLEYDYLIEELPVTIEAIEHKDLEKAERDRKSFMIRHIKQANKYFLHDIKLY